MADELAKLITPEKVARPEPVGPVQPWINVTPAAGHEHISLLDALGTLRKRRWEVAAIAMAILISGTIYSFKAIPVYQATARLDIEAETPSLQSLVGNMYANVPTAADESFLITQTQVLTSENLAWQTIQQLKLADNPTFTDGITKNQRETADSDVARGHLTHLFNTRLSVELQRNSHIVEVGFESTDRRLAANVVNALVANYLEYNFTTKYATMRQASGFMEQQLDELKAKVEKSQAALVDYERANSIVNVSDKQNLAEQRLSELTTDLTRVESDRAEKESLYRLVKANPANIAMLAQNLLLENLQEKYADLKAQYADAQVIYGSRQPKVARLKEQVDTVQSLIQQEQQRTVDRIRRDYDAVVEREKLLTASVAEQKTEVGRLNQLLIQQNILKRDFETNQQLYDNLMQHLKDATVMAGLRATNIHVVDRAVPPAAPVRPKKVLNMALALLAGIILGVSFAFLQEALDKQKGTVNTLDDVQRLVNLPGLGLIPLWTTDHNSHSYGYGYGGPRKRKTPELISSKNEVGVLILDHPSSPVVESYRALRTSIMFSTAPKPPQVILVTSGQPKEGKTATAVSLAMLMAQTTPRVLFLDCDLRIPRASKLLSASNQKGISGILTGAYGLSEALQQVEGQQGLWVLPSGPLPPNPAELLCSSAMQSLLLDLRERFDQIVIDSPPVLLVTDAAVLSPLADGTVLVVASGVCTPASLARTYQIVRTTGARVLGVVLNKVDIHRHGYESHYYYSYHGSYYQSYYRSFSEDQSDGDGHA
jgi:capsular exopolysaccharide synthesis family protein